MEEAVSAADARRSFWRLMPAGDEPRRRFFRG